MAGIIMTARIFIRPPARPSNGAMALRRELGDNARISRLSVVPRQYSMVINWGNSAPLTGWLRRGTQMVYLNLAAAIAVASNKLAAFNQLATNPDVNIPEYTTHLYEVDGMWMARTKLTGHSGDGIVVMREGEEVVPAPLYTRYIKKQLEYRLHVVRGEVIFVQQKRKQSEREQTADEKLIRSHDNGWIYCIENVEVSDEVREQAIKAVHTLNLDFGAVDLVIERDTGKPYVLEVNTAPGLSSPTLLTAYVKAFNQLGGFS